MNPSEPLLALAPLDHRRPWPPPPQVHPLLVQNALYGPVQRAMVPHCIAEPQSTYIGWCAHCDMVAMDDEMAMDMTLHHHGSVADKSLATRKHVAHDGPLLPKTWTLDHIYLFDMTQKSYAW